MSSFQDDELVTAEIKLDEMRSVRCPLHWYRAVAAVEIGHGIARRVQGARSGRAAHGAATGSGCEASIGQLLCGLWLPTDRVECEPTGAQRRDQQEDPAIQRGELTVVL